MKSISKLVVILAAVATTIGTGRHENQTFESRVIGGFFAQERQFPYTVFIEKNGAFHCGGSILTPRWIISAAHCFYQHWPKEFIVYAGLLNQNERNQNRNVQRSQITQFYMHPQYQHLQGNHPSDLAMAQLTTPLQYTDFVKSINLPRENTEMFGGSAVTSGWGKTGTESSSNTLKYFVAPLLNSRDCNIALQFAQGNDRTTELHICTDDKHQQGRQAGCYGDSGGPLVQNNNILVGVLSWVIEGCAKGPTVYTRVGQHLNFINKYIYQ